MTALTNVEIEGKRRFSRVSAVVNITVFVLYTVKKIFHLHSTLYAGIITLRKSSNRTMHDSNKLSSVAKTTLPMHAENSCIAVQLSANS